MLEKVSRYLRVVTTGLSFFVFGAGGLVLRVLVFPVLNLFIWDRLLRTLMARGTIRLSFRAFIGFMRVTGVLHYRFTGLEKLERQGLLILANHPTLLDTVFLMALVKRADCIVKSKLRDNPFTRGPVRAADYISNDNGAGLIDDCIASLRGGGNLIVFPEGTRTPEDGDISFKRGAANVAVRGERNVTPVVINCTPPSLRKGEKWWKVPARRMYFTIDVREDIDVRPFIAEADSEVLAARHLTDYLQDYFIKENQRHAVA